MVSGTSRKGFDVVMGAFVARSRFNLPREFFHCAWDVLMSGPAVIVPHRCGNWEPLCPIADVSLDNVLADNFIASNEVSCLAMAYGPASKDRSFFILTLILKGEEKDAAIAYRWLHDCLPVSICYQATLTDALFHEHRQFHQMLNAGLVELDLPKARDQKELFDSFEEFE